ncbi:MAG TPA: site-specific integrase [Chthoniobacterales bacterium]|nr:site-specific integrase [Chthoniobacterales bacterium]
MAHSTDTLSQPLPMPRHTHLLRRGSRYYLNVKVPKDLRTVLKKELIRKALKTSDPHEAARTVRFESLQLDALFNRERAKLRRDDVPSRQLRSISRQEAHSLVFQWFAGLEEMSEEWWENEGRNLSDIRETLDTLRIDAAALQGGTPNYQEDDGSFDLDAFLKGNPAINCPKDSAAYQQLRPLFRRARLENTRRTMDRVTHKTIATHDPIFRDTFAHTPARVGREIVTLGEMLERFIAALQAAKRSAGTLRTYEIPARILRENIGASASLDSITREQISHLFKLLKQAPSNATKRYPGLTLEQAIVTAGKRGDDQRLGPKTLENYFNNVGAIFNFAVERGWMLSNPTKDRLMRASFENGGNAKPKELFTIEQLNLLFRAPLYTGCKNDESGYAKPGPNQPRRGRFWVPLLALFHGFRCNEAAQLYTEDVGEENRILYIDIRSERANGDKCEKRLKSAQSNRRVPVHSAILKIGFGEFVEARRRDKSHPRLFPELPLGANGYFSDPFSKWFGHFVETAVGPECKATFHSFRHQFRNALDEAGVPIPDVELLGGWELMRHSAESDYRRGPRLSGARLLRMRRHIEKVRYPGLNLSHLLRE